MISPIVAKLSVSDLAKTGRTVGEIYAAGALGSIVGTFLTGFVLISTFGSYTIVFGVTLVLAAIGIMFFIIGRWQSAVLAIAMVAAGWALESSPLLASGLLGPVTLLSEQPPDPK